MKILINIAIIIIIVIIIYNYYNYYNTNSNSNNNKYIMIARESLRGSGFPCASALIRAASSSGPITSDFRPYITKNCIFTHKFLIHTYILTYIPHIKHDTAIKRKRKHDTRESKKII
jgi:hypothetical protein